MAGPFALGAKVVESAREAGAEEEFPEAIGENAAGERVIGLDDPLGQIEPRQSFVRRALAREERWKCGRDDFTVVVHPVSSREHANHAWLDALRDE